MPSPVREEGQRAKLTSQEGGPILGLWETEDYLTLCLPLTSPTSLELTAIR